MDGTKLLQLAFPLRAVGYPAPDLPGVWLAHALDLDVMAQGDSPQHAAGLLEEAVWEMVAFRLSNGLPPVDWTPAPDEVWQAAERVIGKALDRAPPVMTSEVTALVPEHPPGPTQLIVADRAPAVAHAS